MDCKTCLILLFLFNAFTTIVAYTEAEPLVNTWKNPYNNGSATCGDRMLRYAQISNSSMWFGCCSTRKITNTSDTMNYCCLTFGSKCADDSGVKCCREERCCGGQCVMTAGTPKFKELGLKTDSRVMGTRPTNSMTYLNTTITSVNCSDKTYPVYVYGKIYNSYIFGCCKQNYGMDLKATSTGCCILAGSPCDSSIPCCNDIGQSCLASTKSCAARSSCVGGRCSGSSGSPKDAVLGGTCNRLEAPTVNKLLLKISDNTTCSDTVFKYYAESDDKATKACCRAKPLNATDSTNHCCLLGGSKCDGGISCCRHLLCCGGQCSYTSGYKYSSDLETPFRAC